MIYDQGINDKREYGYFEHGLFVRNDFLPKKNEVIIDLDPKKETSKEVDDVVAKLLEKNYSLDDITRLSYYSGDLIRKENLSIRYKLLRIKKQKLVSILT